MSTTQIPISAMMSTLQQAADTTNHGEGDAELLEHQLGNGSDSWREIERRPCKPADFRSLAKVIEENSVEVSPSTDEEYKQLMGNFEQTLITMGYQLPPDGLWGDIITLPEMPLLIIAWIMAACDMVNPDGSPKEPDEVLNSYSHAMKMRAALTYGFGRCYGRGTSRWTEISPGEFQGNPSISTEVSRYMVSLKRRKAANGDSSQQSMSTMPIRSSQIKLIFELLHECPQNPHSDSPLGPLMRQLIHTVIVIAFTCLLRLDEVLSLRVEDIEVLDGDRIKITLPKRKTKQTGDVPPFVLWKFSDKDAYLCPVRALAQWLKVSEIQSGYLFRTIAPNPERVRSQDSHITSATWIHGFRHYMVDIGIDGTYYAGHSLRRGGCQWLAFECNWSIYEICDWGGWSVDFQHGAIIRYLFNNVGNENARRDNYMNPNRSSITVCFQCRRQCNCKAAVPLR